MHPHPSAATEIDNPYLGLRKSIEFVQGKPDIICFCVLLISAALVAGCSSHQASAPAAILPTVQPVSTLPEVAVTSVMSTPGKIAEKTAEKTAENTGGIVILTTKDAITPSTYKTYDFEEMGYDFLQPDEKYQISLKADKPVLGYAVKTTQANQLAGSELIPHYVSYSDKIQWGLTNPYMVMEKVTDTKKVFTVESIGRYTYVIDGRWMAGDDIYKNEQSVSYAITITKLTPI